MSDRPTPETDALKVSAEAALGLARTLKRERDEALEMARELRDAMKAITPYIGYPSTPTQVIYQFKNALTKAKKVLP